MSALFLLFSYVGADITLRNLGSADSQGLFDQEVFDQSLFDMSSTSSPRPNNGGYAGGPLVLLLGQGGEDVTAYRPGGHVVGGRAITRSLAGAHKETPHGQVSLLFL